MAEPTAVPLRTTARPSPAAVEVTEPGEASPVPDGGADRRASPLCSPAIGLAPGRRPLSFEGLAPKIKTSPPQTRPRVSPGLAQGVGGGLVPGGSCEGGGTESTGHRPPR